MSLDPRLYPSGTAGNVAIGQVYRYSQTVTPASVNAATSVTRTITVTGVKVGDIVVVQPAATGNATAVGAAYVSDVDTVSVFYTNPTAGALTPGAGTYTFLVFRPVTSY